MNKQPNPFYVTTDADSSAKVCAEVWAKLESQSALLADIPMLRSAENLIAEWSRAEFKWQFTEVRSHERRIYSRKDETFHTVGSFKESSTSEFLKTLQREAKEANPPFCKKQIPFQEMPTFYRAWVGSAFRQLWLILPRKDQIPADQLPRKDRELYICRLCSLFQRPLHFFDPGCYGRRFISSLWKQACSRDPDETFWRSFEAYPVWFRICQPMDTGGPIRVQVAMRFDLVIMLNRRWGEEFRTDERFARVFTELGLGECSKVRMGGVGLKVLLFWASAIGLNPVPGEPTVERTMCHEQLWAA